MAVYIEPHERYEAMDVYKDRLSADQLDQIQEASDTAIVKITWGGDDDRTVVSVNALLRIIEQKADGK